METQLKYFNSNITLVFTKKQYYLSQSMDFHMASHSMTMMNYTYFWDFDTPEALLIWIVPAKWYYSTKSLIILKFPFSMLDPMPLLKKRLICVISHQMWRSLVLTGKWFCLLDEGHLEKLLADKKLDEEKRNEYESVLGQVRWSWTKCPEDRCKTNQYDEIPDTWTRHKESPWSNV